MSAELASRINRQEFSQSFKPVPKRPLTILSWHRQAVVIAAVAFVVIAGGAVFFILQAAGGKDQAQARLLSGSDATAGVSGGLTVEKLLGRWTVVSGSSQCALNLTQTQKGGTGRYRASAPACPLTGLTQVASWTVAGPQVQLFNEGGNLIATLILSGNRFIGTLAGGTGISMVG